ncbi:MAG: M1 family metallopeptidase [Actinomycetota bacterium]
MWRRVALVGALGVLAACSGDAEDSGATTTEAPVSTAPASTAGTGPTTTPPPPVPVGAPTVGDPYVPAAGSGGFDAISYAVDVEIDPELGRIDGTVVIEAALTETVRAISFDIEPGIGQRWVQVDGRPVTTIPIDRGLEIVLPSVGDPGDEIEIEIAYFGFPEPLNGVVPFTDVGWSTETWGVVAASEPRGTATWMPVVDHPSDKATWEFWLTVPSPFEAVASGRLVERIDAGGGSTTFRWAVDDPMAPHAALLLVADLELVELDEVDGVEVTVAAPTATVPTVEASLADLPEMLDTFEGWFGPYPFGAFGIAVPPGRLGFAALETQELSLFDARALDVPGDAVVAHELAHMWFGNHVSPERWEDIWLLEGLATYAEWLWFEASEGRPADVLADLYLDTAGPTQLLPPPGTPPIENLFVPAVYGRSALAFHDLRTRVGDEAFAELLQTWVERFGGANGSTEDWFALVEEQVDAAAADRMRAWAFDDDPPS